MTGLQYQTRGQQNLFHIFNHGSQFLPKRLDRTRFSKIVNQDKIKRLTGTNLKQVLAFQAMDW